jgi:hypothetical protein
MLKALESKGVGTSPEAVFHKNEVIRIITETNKQFGNVFKIPAKN